MAFGRKPQRKRLEACHQAGRYAQPDQGATDDQLRQRHAGGKQGATRSAEQQQDSLDPTRAVTVEQDAQRQLEGTENRITVARNRYIKSVEGYNVSVRTFPNNLTAMMFGYQVKPNFSVENEKEISSAPKVDFGGGK